MRGQVEAADIQRGLDESSVRCCLASPLHPPPASSSASPRVAAVMAVVPCSHARLLRLSIECHRKSLPGPAKEKGYFMLQDAKLRWF
ncbi:hypothetical protein GQ55_9G368800 [Panicum hallii var. hallii]|uniref:Uncharacterized protein n=1 Tax=Panicum hallii var. hallii TaxID=1504633 RepID=A0A2T7C8X5_9POAL|nr:hypothetical protein GQ55_9G368800 [Panicum hallii var. hallii]